MLNEAVRVIDLGEFSIKRPIRRGGRKATHVTREQRGLGAAGAARSALPHPML